MKKKYSISFFAVMFTLVILLSIAYQMGYQKTIAEERGKKVNKEQNVESLAAEGKVKKSESYYLKELNGFVVVYLSDQKTIYEYTTIPVDNLPEEVALEISNGMKIDTSESLYSFLEGYSS